MKKFEEMTKAELIEVAEKYELMDKFEGKDPQKVTNAEYLEVLNEFKAEKNEGKDEEPKEEKVKKIKQLRTEDLMTMVPVIVTDHDTSVEIKDDEGARGIELYWGNPFIGQTERVFMHGKRQYLTKGLLKRMRKMTVPETIKDEHGREIARSVRPRFSIVEVAGMTEEELLKLEQKQRLMSN